MVMVTFGVIKQVTATSNDSVIFWGHKLDQTDEKVTVTFGIRK